MTKNDAVKIAINGAAGRMGRALINAALVTPNAKLSAAVDRPNCPDLGMDAGSFVGLPASGVELSDNLAAALAASDVLVDFTRPEGTMTALDACVKASRAMVIGTTGMTPEQKTRIDAAAKQIPICMAANFSIGVSVTMKLLELAAKTFGNTVDIEILETHHKHKLDSPSGTALVMGEVVAQATGRNLKDVALYGREGQVGARDRNTIGFSAIRGGDVVGDHTVMFLAEGERLEITHKATSRLNFAQGAIRTAIWLSGRKPGFYSMREVLGL